MLLFNPDARWFKAVSVVLFVSSTFALGAAARGEEPSAPAASGLQVSDSGVSGPRFDDVYAQMRAAGAGMAPIARTAAALARDGDLESVVIIDLMERTEAFSKVALAASERLRAGGPQDLACIYLGLSQDADARGRALAQQGLDAQPADLEALAALFDDAVLVTPEPTQDDAGPEGPAFTCQATKTALNTPAF